MSTSSIGCLWLLFYLALYFPAISTAQVLPTLPNVTFYGSVERLLADNAKAEFKEKASKHFKVLQALGVPKIGSRKIDDLILGIQNIHIVVVDEIRFENQDLFGSYRGSAYWDKRINTVFLAYSHWKKFDDNDKEAIGAHEVCGPLGINDNDFGLTATMEAYSTLNRISDRKPGLKNTKGFKFFEDHLTNGRLLKDGGGVTGVGNGGDRRPLNYKVVLMLEAILSYEFDQLTGPSFLRLMDFYQELSVEFSKTLQQGDFIFLEDEKKLLIPSNAFSTSNMIVNHDSAIKINEFLAQKFSEAQP